MNDETKVFTEHDLFAPDFNEGKFVPDALIDNVDELHAIARSAGFSYTGDVIQLRELKVTGRRDVKAISGGDAAQGQVIYCKDYANAKARVLREWVVTRKGYKEITDAS